MGKSGNAGSHHRSPTDIDRLVGDNVRKLRIQRDLTLLQLARELKISHQQLQKYETGTNRLSAGTLCEVAEALGVSIEHLFRSEDPGAGKLRTKRTDALEELRAQGSYWLARARSERKLRQMVDVLRALSSDS